MKIALDAMGGDFAPQVTVEGALQARDFLSAEDAIILVGKKEVIEAELEKQGADKGTFYIVDAPTVIEMGENPTKAVAAKQDSSIMIGLGGLAQGKFDAFCSAGNTGAMMVGSLFTVKMIEGVLRPVIAGFMPKTSGRYGIVIDVGANSDCKPEFLKQFATIGSLYMQYNFGIDNPTVGLLSIGTEESKGNLLTQAAFPLIQENKDINFIGNIEGRDIITDKADVIVCDGFIGNVILKMGESFYPILEKKGFVDDFVELFNYENVGASPILGVNGNVIVGHGASTAKAITGMIKLASEQIKSDIVSKIKNTYK